MPSAFCRGRRVCGKPLYRSRRDAELRRAVLSGSNTGSGPLDAGWESVTASAKLWLAARTAPVLASVTRASRPNVELPARAAEQPVKLSVHATAPDAVAVGVLHDAVMPLGNPETRLMVAPPVLAIDRPVIVVPRSGERIPRGGPGERLGWTPVAADETVTPPTGVAVTVTVAVEIERMESAVGETLSWIPGACCTVSA